MEDALVDPAEAIAHVLAHDLRAPLFMAAELLAATADEVGRSDSVGGTPEPSVSPELQRRLEVVVEGLREACRTADHLVQDLRPDEGTGTIRAAELSERARQAWGDATVEVDVAPDREVPERWLGLVDDLVRAAPDPVAVSVRLGRGLHCQVTLESAPSRAGSVAFARIARRVSSSLIGGGELRLGRSNGGVMIDVRTGEGAERP